MKTLPCGCEVAGEGITAEVVQPCPRGQAVIDGLRWEGDWLLAQGPEWEAYRAHFAALLPEDGPPATPPCARVFLPRGKE